MDLAALLAGGNILEEEPEGPIIDVSLRYSSRIKVPTLVVLHPPHSSPPPPLAIIEEVDAFYQLGTPLCNEWFIHVKSKLEIALALVWLFEGVGVTFLSAHKPGLVTGVFGPVRQFTGQTALSRRTISGLLPESSDGTTDLINLLPYVFDPGKMALGDRWLGIPDAIKALNSVPWRPVITSLREYDNLERYGLVNMARVAVAEVLMNRKWANITIAQFFRSLRISPAYLPSAYFGKTVAIPWSYVQRFGVQSPRYGLIVPVKFVNARAVKPSNRILTDYGSAWSILRAYAMIQFIILLADRYSIPHASAAELWSRYKSVGIDDSHSLTISRTSYATSGHSIAFVLASNTTMCARIFCAMALNVLTGGLKPATVETNKRGQVWHHPLEIGAGLSFGYWLIKDSKDSATYKEMHEVSMSLQVTLRLCDLIGMRDTMSHWDPPLL